jgi:hypothetical protein
MLLSHNYIQDQYKRRWQSVRGAADAQTALQEAQAWALEFKLGSLTLAEQADLYAAVERRRPWLEYLAAATLQQFYANIFAQLKQDIKPKYQKAALAGEIPLCWDALCRVLSTGPPHLVSGNRMKYKAGPAELVNDLFDFDDGGTRGAWRKLPYRYLYEKAIGLINKVLGQGAGERWAQHVKRVVLFTCWLLPYPCGPTFFDRTKPSAGEASCRMWFSVYYYNTYRPGDTQIVEEMSASLSNGEEGKTMHELDRLARQWPHWKRGLKKVMNGQPLAAKMVLQLRGLNGQEREEHFAKLLA